MWLSTWRQVYTMYNLFDFIASELPYRIKRTHIKCGYSLIHPHNLWCRINCSWVGASGKSVTASVDQLRSKCNRVCPVLHKPPLCFVLVIIIIVVIIIIIIMIKFAWFSHPQSSGQQHCGDYTNAEIPYFREQWTTVHALLAWTCHGFT